MILSVKMLINTSYEIAGNDASGKCSLSTRKRSSEDKPEARPHRRGDIRRKGERLRRVCMEMYKMVWE